MATSTSTSTDIPSTMAAVGFTDTGAADVLTDITVDVPSIGEHDLLVKVHAVSINPVDYKVRNATPGLGQPGPFDAPKVIGYDASGVVVGVGSAVTLYAVGDEVYYAGDISRQGTNAEYHAVDERIAGTKPKTLSHADAAAMPLVTLTAWEAIFEGLRVPRKGAPRTEYETVEHGSTDKPTVLVIAGAGGVGSIAIQILKQLTEATVVATASRPESIEYSKAQGADVVINHHEDFKPQLDAAGVTGGIDYAFVTPPLSQSWDQVLSVLRPLGKVAAVIPGSDADMKTINVGDMFMKRQSLTWVMMFARALTGLNMVKQHELLTEAGTLFDSGVLKSTRTGTFTGLKASEVAKAHEAQETGRMIGKSVVVFVEEESRK